MPSLNLSSETIWMIVGFAGQAIFTGRFLVQWIASEKRGQSYIPPSFWFMSLFGSWMLLAYAISRKDPVIIAGQMFGVVVYGRNLALIYKKANKESSNIKLANTTSDIDKNDREEPKRQAA